MATTRTNERPRRGSERVPARQARTRAEQRQAARKQHENRSVSLGSIAQGVCSFVSKHTKLSIALVLCIFVALALVPPIRDYYISVRTREVLEQNYAELTSENSSLQSDLERLQTPEGIQDEARKRGYVGEGETAVTVEGQDQRSETTTEDPSAPKTYTDTRDAKTRFFDALFGFDPQSVAS